MTVRVLVTGAGGFLGRHVVVALDQLGIEVHATGRRPRPEDLPAGVPWHRADLLDPAQPDPLLSEVRPTHLAHVAWYVEHGRFWEAPENVAWLEATMRLARAFGACGGRRLVGVGTCFEYDLTQRRPCSEDPDVTPLAPASLYAATKYASGLVLTRAAPGLGIQCCWARVFLLYGRDEHPERLATSVARRVAEGMPAPIGSGRQVRDFLPADVAGAALAAIVLADGVEGPVNVGSGHPISIERFARRIAYSVAGTEGEDLIDVGALPDRPGDPAYIVADTTRLQTRVGWTPPAPDYAY